MADLTVHSPPVRRTLWPAPVLTALLFVAWALPGLIGHDPWKPDEAYSFGLVYHALQNPSPHIPMLAGEPFVEKPPLYYLTAAASAWLFSPPLALHDAARLATGFYMAVAAAFVWLAARLLFTAVAANLAVVLLIGSVGLVVRGHQLITDVALLAGFAMALYGFARALKRPLAGGFWLGTGIGIGFMAKGLLAPGVLGIAAVILPLVSPAWRRREYLACLAVAAVSAAPWLLVWPAALYHASPDLFHTWFWDNNFGRFLGTNQLGPTAERAHYWKILPWYTIPVLPLAAWTLWSAVRSRALTAPLRLPLLVFAVLLAVLSVSSDARELYAMPLLVPLALLAAPAAIALPRPASTAWYRLSVIGFTALVAVAWAAWAALEFGTPAAAHRALLKLAPAYETGVRWLPLLAALAYTCAWAFLVPRLKPDVPGRSAVAWTAGLTVVWALAMTLHVGWIDSSKSYRSVAMSLKAALPPAYHCISSRELGEPQRALFEYFAGVVTFREENPERRHLCELMLVQQRSRTEKTPQDGELIWQGARPGDPAEHFLLYRLRL